VQRLGAGGIPARFPVELLKPRRLEQPSKEMTTRSGGVQHPFDALAEVVVDGVSRLDNL
jgi:hypothetical protein